MSFILRDPETRKGIIVFLLIILFASGTGFRLIAKIIKNYVE